MANEPIALKQLLAEAKVFFDENYLPNPPLILYQMAYSVSGLEKLDPSFSEILFKFIKEKGITETECYKKANLDRRLFSKIRSNVGYQPSKNTVFALCIGLGLNLEEAKTLLDSAGYSLSRSIKMDTVMAFLFTKQISDIFVANEIIESFSCALLGNNQK